MASKLTSDDAAALPRGLTCGDCAHFQRCSMLFGCASSNTECDWSPSRFRLPPVVRPEPKWSPYP